MARDIDIRDETGAREAVQTMDWGLVIDEGWQDGVTTVYCVGQGERADTARKLREVADKLDPPAAGDGERRDPATVTAAVREALAPHFGGPEESKPTTVEMARALSRRVVQLSRELRGRGVETARIPWEGEAPDVVSRMIDARKCLRTDPDFVRSGRADAQSVSDALRQLDEGIEEGMVQRELYGALRQLVAGEEHLCTCSGHELDDVAEPGGCRGLDGRDRCRFEAALRSLLGVETVP